jgi:hypothetical protein
MLCRGERDVNATKRRVDRMTASDLQIKTLPPSEGEKGRVNKKDRDRESQRERDSE